MDYIPRLNEGPLSKDLNAELIKATQGLPISAR